VLLDRLLLEAEGTQTYAGRTPELREICTRVIDEAIAQYLRVFPMARNKDHTFVQMPRTIDGVGEIDFLCLFCRASLNTVAAGSGSLPQGFWIKLQKHSDLCAVEFLLGRLDPVGPNGERTKKQRVIAVHKLTGRRLIEEAKAAAEYLGWPEPKARTAHGRAGRVAGGRTGELRKIVSEARRQATLRAKQLKQTDRKDNSDAEED
jgi:hypothetical protein